MLILLNRKLRLICRKIATSFPEIFLSVRRFHLSYVSLDVLQINLRIACTLAVMWIIRSCVENGTPSQQLTSSSLRSIERSAPWRLVAASNWRRTPSSWARYGYLYDVIPASQLSVKNTNSAYRRHQSTFGVVHVEFRCTCSCWCIYSFSECWIA